jgi:hypothetical protein
MEILNHYSNHALATENVNLPLPKKPQEIELSQQIAEKLNPIAMKVGEQFELHGIRAKINFRNLLKSLAYRNRRKVVTEAEYQEFLELANHMNFKFETMK